MAGTILASAKAYLEGLGDILDRIDAEVIEQFASLLFEAWRDGRRVFVFGNGGSASTASHHACDFVKTAAVDGQRRLKAMSLVDNIGLGTALGNDISYDETFSYPLATYARRGDLAVAISGSGNSANVVRACEWAKAHGVTVVGLTGFSGGRLKELADVHIHVPSDNYGIVEDLHLTIGHIAAQVFKSRVLSETDGHESVDHGRSGVHRLPHSRLAAR